MTLWSGRHTFNNIIHIKKSGASICYIKTSLGIFHNAIPSTRGLAAHKRVNDSQVRQILWTHNGKCQHYILFTLVLCIKSLECGCPNLFNGTSLKPNEGSNSWKAKIKKNKKRRTNHMKSIKIGLWCSLRTQISQ